MVSFREIFIKMEVRMSTVIIDKWVEAMEVVDARVILIQETIGFVLREMTLLWIISFSVINQEMER